MGYQNSTDFCEVWPERSLDVVKLKRVGIFEMCSISPMVIFKAMRIVYSLLLELDSAQWTGLANGLDLPMHWDLIPY